MNRFRLDITNWLVAVIALAVLSAATGHWWSPGIEPHFTYLPEGAPGHARSLNELLLRPDVIAVGTVVRSGTGRSVGEAIAGVPRSQTHLEFVETVLAVESVLAGDIPGETVRIETEKDGRAVPTRLENSRDACAGLSVVEARRGKCRAVLSAYL